MEMSSSEMENVVVRMCLRRRPVVYFVQFEFENSIIDASRNVRK